MDKVLNVFSRLRSIWTAVKTPTEAERARNDDIQNTESTRFPDQVEVSRDLQQFRLLVGIVHDKSFRAPYGFKPDALPINTLESRPAPNVGIYTRVYAAEIKCKKNFKNTSLLINSCLGIQIVVAAALTALGAANHSGSSVTVFGAINTVIAGFLTYLKGSGLPNRLKYYQHEWAKIREYIEQRERDLQCGHGFDVMQEVETIRQMYEGVKKDIEYSRPDRFVGVTGSAAMAAPQPLASNKTFSDASGELNHFKSGIHGRVREVEDLEKGLATFGKGWFHEKQTEANATIDKARHFDEKISSNVTGLKARLEDKIKDIGHFGHDLEEQGKARLAEKQGDVVQMVQTNVREVNAIGRDIESNARQVFDESKNTIGGTIAHQQASLRRTLSDHEVAAHAAITERANAARASILESELAAKSAILSRQADAHEALAAHTQAAASAVAESEASLHSTARNVIDQAFDAASGTVPHEPRHD